MIFFRTDHQHENHIDVVEPSLMGYAQPKRNLIAIRYNQSLPRIAHVIFHELRHLAQAERGMRLAEDEAEVDACAEADLLQTLHGQKIEALASRVGGMYVHTIGGTSCGSEYCPSSMEV